MNAMLDFTGVLSPACSAHPLWGFGWRLGGKSDFCLMRFFLQRDTRSDVGCW